MKILVTLTFYHPHWTGLTAYAKRLAEGLVARGHEVTVLTSQHSADLPLEEWIGGVHVVRLPFVARVSRTVIMPGFPATAARLIAAHDLVHIHTPMPELLLVTSLARALGKPSVVTHQGDVVMPAGVTNQLIQRAMDTTMTMGMQLSTRVVVHSGDYGRHSTFLAPIAHKLDAIYPPVEMPEPQPEVIAAWKSELGLEGKRLVGFAGRFVEEKGFDFLLRAVPLVLEQVPDAHFVYAGETHVVYEPFFERWRHLLDKYQDAISVLGLIRDPQKMANFYAMCDVFALPSRTDCFPSVQIEALMSGTPLVTADIPGAREVVQVTSLGRMVAPRDPHALAEGIVALLNTPHEYQPTRARVQTVFSPTRSLDEYEALMTHLVHGVSAKQAQKLDAARTQARNTLQAVSASTLLATPPALPRKPSAAPTNLSVSDRATLERLLQNEADMAFRRRAMALLDHLDLHDGESVLDCGCGMGVYMMMMSRLRNLNIVGVDGDVGRLEWAEREGVDARLSRVDIHTLPFADASFDKVLMTEVLEHIAEDRVAMREVFRVLKPGGTLALSVPHANYPLLWDPINKAIEALGLSPMRGPGPITGLWSNHWRLYTPETLSSVISSAGFEIEALEEQTHYAFPFIHFIVYSIGKPLIELNLLPEKLRNSADRFRGERNSGSLLNPINLGVRAFRWADKQNDNLRGNEQTFVNIVVKARKPA
ncbi:MAG: glycosyltransferase [Chloroflexi bacterium SZAS-1]|jgi:glycosyltransferase involved in cell wall biosynthesis/ubiquinone/menaquinone biosynthesis C-methylase UbiE|nr:glycosyltransferase [Chloroflexi bacterium SZAS-1]